MPVKLLLVTTAPVTLRSFLLPLARHFREAGWRVDGAARGISRDLECKSAFDRIWDIDWSRDPRHLDNFLQAPRQIRALVHRERYDIVHVATPVASFVTRLALRMPRLGHRPAVIYSAHGFHFHQQGGPLTNAVFIFLEKCAAFHDFLVVTNREDEAAALTYRLAPPARVVYIPGVGVDAAAQYDPARTTADAIVHVREQLGLSPTTPLFVMVAEFNPGKRHRDAIEALALVNRTTEAHLALTSDGPLRPELETLAARLGLQGRVHFLGFVDDINALIRASLAMVLPSVREGLPRSMLEALSLGVAGIGYRVRGVGELLDGGCGLLCPPRDVAAVAQAMLGLIARPHEARAMGQRGREKMLRTYTLDRVLAAHDRLYQAALSAREGWDSVSPTSPSSPAQVRESVDLRGTVPTSTRYPHGPRS